MSRGSTKQNEDHVVRYELDLDNPSPLTPAQRARLEALAAMPDEDIDFSDIPPLDEKSMGKPTLFRRRRREVTVGIEADLLAWLKAAGEDYEKTLNAVLREAMARAAKE